MAALPTVVGITGGVHTGAIAVALSWGTHATRSRTHPTCGTGRADAATAGLPIGTAGRTRIAGTMPASSWATNGLGTSMTGRSTGVAESLPMRRITGTLLGGCRIGSKDGGAELGAGLILPEGGADASQAEETAKGGGSDGFEGLTP